jgi:hypothetical protein
MNIVESKLRRLIREELALEGLRRRLLREEFDAAETATDLLKIVKAAGGDLDRAADQIEMMMGAASKGYDTEELRAIYRPFVAGAQKLGIDTDAKKQGLKKVLLALRGN